MIDRYLCLLASLLGITAILLKPVTAHSTPKIGEPLPAFTATTTGGQQVTDQNYRGRVLLLVFSTDYCSACKKAIPDINKLADQYGKQGFSVLGLLSGFGWDNDDLKSYMVTYGVHYPMALFEERFAKSRFGLISVPYFMLTGKRGVVSGLYYGSSETTLRQMEEQMKKLLRE